MNIFSGPIHWASNMHGFNPHLLLLFHHSVVPNSVTPCTAACQASLSFTISQSLLKLMSIESMMPSNRLILYPRFSSCPQSFPVSGSFPMSQLFTSDGQRIVASASVLPMNVQGWFSLSWLVRSPCCQRDSQQSSPAPQFKSINSLALSLHYGSTLTSVHDYWKNIALTIFLMLL